jgi:repressor LexA
MRSDIVEHKRKTGMSEQRKDYRALVLRFVEVYVQENGYPPTYQEIMESVGLGSKSHVDYYLGALEAEQLIERKPRSPRSVRPLGTPPSTFGVSVEGTVTAGRGVSWAKGEAPTIDVTACMAGRRRDIYALRVQGDSMLDELVGHGDILIIERRPWALSGEVAVVYEVDRGEARLAKLTEGAARGRRPRPQFGVLPVVVDSKEMQIDGGLVAVIRQP